MVTDELSKLESLKDQFSNAAQEAENNYVHYSNLGSSKENAIGVLINEMQLPFLIFGIILLCFAAFLVVAIIIQSNKSQKGLSGAITGGSADTFYGRNKGKDKSKILAIVTIVVVVLFILSVLAVCVLQYDLSGLESEKDSLNALAGSYRADKGNLDKNVASVQSQIDSILQGTELKPDPQA